MEAAYILFTIYTLQVINMDLKAPSIYKGLHTYIYRPQQSALFILQFLAIANSFLLVKLYINQLSTLISLLNYKILLTTTKKPSQKAIHRSKNTICPLRLNSANHGSCMQLRIRAKFSWFASWRATLLLSPTKNLLHLHPFCAYLDAWEGKYRYPSHERKKGFARWRNQALVQPPHEHNTSNSKGTRTYHPTKP